MVGVLGVSEGGKFEQPRRGSWGCLGSVGEQFGVCGGVLGVIWGLTQSPPLPSLRMKSAPHAEPPPSGAEEPDLERLKQVLGGGG